MKKILEKIKKLKALYEGAKKINSEGEANNAARAIQALLTEYNLEMAEIDFQDCEFVKEKIVGGSKLVSYAGKWEINLLTALAYYNFCQVFYVTNNWRDITLVGNVENVETVKWLFDYLYDQFMHLGRIRYKEYSKTLVKKPNRVTFIKNYMKGCIDGLRLKLREERQTLEEAATNETGNKVTDLVLVQNAKLNEFVNEAIGQFKHSTIKGSNGSDASRLGINDGRNISLNKQMNSDNKSTKYLQ